MGWAGVQDLLAKCHPLGMFDSIATLAVASNMRELYRLVLVDTPLASYFAETLTSEDLDEMNIEILRNTLYKVPTSARSSCLFALLDLGLAGRARSVCVRARVHTRAMGAGEGGPCVGPTQYVLLRVVLPRDPQRERMWVHGGPDI